MNWLSNIFSPNDSEKCPVCDGDMANQVGNPLSYVDTSAVSKPADQQHFVSSENYAETCSKCGQFEGQNLSDIRSGNVGEF